MAEKEPRWRPESRKRFALAKYYGISGETWTISEIAEYLRVSETTVSKYIFQSDMGDEVAKRLADVEAQTRLDIVMRLFDQLERLDEIEEKLLSEKEAMVTGYIPSTVSGTPSFSDGSFEIQDAGEMEFTVPAADTFDEKPVIDEVKQVWEEKRAIIQDIEDLLGLEEPEKMEVESEHTEMKMEKKVYEFRDADDSGSPLPAQEPQSLGEKYGNE